MNKFYQRLALWALKKAEQSINSAQVKCPQCNMWSNRAVVLELDYDLVDKPYGFSYNCGNCNTTSNWNTLAAPVALRCDDNGVPYYATASNKDN